MNDQKKQFLDVLDDSANILVTVRNNPDIDQLAACISLTLMLNELGKRATAVFSGKVPAVLDFLDPHKILQSNTDSLQDFIISLDKAKADKLRYKVEDETVKIFITPYKTALTKKDLHFEAGDFNVDMVIALGVHVQDDIDHAIAAHGRILHDASVAVLNIEPTSADDIGNIHWVDEASGSLSEMITNSIDDLVGVQTEVLDSQVATALLAGIVAATNRFGNSRTKPSTMQAAGRLLSAGANQELVAGRLSSSLPLSPLPAGLGSAPNAVPDDNKESDHSRNRPGSRAGRHSRRNETVEHGFAHRPARPAQFDEEDDHSESDAVPDGGEAADGTADKSLDVEGAAANVDGEKVAEATSEKQSGRPRKVKVIDASESESEPVKPERHKDDDQDDEARQSEDAVDALAISHPTHPGNGEMGESDQEYIMEDVKKPAVTSEVQIHEDKKPDMASHDHDDVDDLTVEELMGETAEDKSAKEVAKPATKGADQAGPKMESAESGEADSKATDKSVEDKPEAAAAGASQATSEISDAKANSPDQSVAILTDAAAQPDPLDSAQNSYDPNQISVPASIATTPAETTAKAGLSPGVAGLSDAADQASQPAAPAGSTNEEQQLLSMIGAVPESSPGRMQLEPAVASDVVPAVDPIQPLRDQGGFVGEPPLQDRKAQASKDSVAPVDSTLDPTKFAITPPSTGGTLTASQVPEAAPTLPVNPLDAAAPSGPASNGLPLKNTSTFIEKKAKNEGEEGPSGGTPGGGDQQLIHHGGKKVLTPLTPNVPAATNSTPGSGAANIAPGSGSLPGLEMIEVPSGQTFGGVAPAGGVLAAPGLAPAAQPPQPFGPRQALEAALGAPAGPAPFAPPTPNGFMPPQAPFGGSPAMAMPGQPDPTLAALNLTGSSGPMASVYSPLSPNPTQPVGAMPPSAPPPLNAVPPQPVSPFGR